MEAFQLRLWDGRIGRWLSPDPYGQYDSPYLGMGNNPISLTDPDGGSTENLDDFYKNLKTGSVEWFDGSGAIDGYEHLGVSFSTMDSYNNVTAWGESRFGDIVSWSQDGGLFHHNYALDEIVVGGARNNGGGRVDFNGYNITSDILRNKLNEFASLQNRIIEVIGGDRDVARNRRVGGATNSRHISGDAADIYINGMTNRDLSILANRSELFNTVIYYPSNIRANGALHPHVHLDLNPNHNNKFLIYTPLIRNNNVIRQSYSPFP